MFRKILYGLLDRFAEAPFFDRYLSDYLYRKPKKCIKSLRRYGDVFFKFTKVARWPDEIRSFEDLSFLFHSSQANYGLCLMAFDEAAYLYKLIATIRDGRIAEIGRFKGGGTLLMAAAMDASCFLDSFDNHAIMALYTGEGRTTRVSGAAFDGELSDALKRYGFDGRVRLHVGDSGSAELDEKLPYDLVFVDGSHEAGGARRDFLKWLPFLKPGGHLLFHDALRARRFAACHKDLAALMSEIEKTYAATLKKTAAPGSLAHFVKMEAVPAAI